MMLGETISHYKILEKLGEGGMGVVYKARDTKLDREVAIKFLPPHLSSDPEAVKRFVHEAKTASALNHSAIGVIHEIDKTDDGQTFIAMAYYEGGTLRDRIDSGSLTADEAVAIASQIASGLSRAHEKGIVHRDIKPQNILLTRDGEAKIIDFGLAKLAGRTKLTRDGSTLGTAAYMSPEQARGEEVDHRSDIFSLGSILYEMLTGEPPFKGEHEAALLYGIVHEEPEAVSNQREDIPEILCAAVDRSLEKETGKRYQNASELKADLRSLMGINSTASSTIASSVRKPIGRRWMIAAGIILIAAVLAFTLRDKLDTGTVQAKELSLAVIDFRDIARPDDLSLPTGLTALIEVGLYESSPVRIISSDLIYDLRRRLFGSGRGLIEPDQVLEVARKSESSFFLTGQITSTGEEQYVTWRLVETTTGNNLAVHRADGISLNAIADRIIEGVLPILGQETDTDLPSTPPSVTSLTTESPEAYGHYVASILALDEGRKKDRVRELEQAVSLDTTFALAYFELARAYFSSSGFHEHKIARGYADRAWSLRARLGVKDRMRLEAYIASLEYRFTDAKATYEEMLERWPDDLEVLFDLQDLLFFRWYFAEALQVVEHGLKLFPDDPRLYYRHCDYLRNMGRMQEGLECNLELAQQDSLNPDNWDNVGLAYITAGLPDSAEVAFHRALSIDPGFLYSQKGLAWCDAVRGNLPEAIQKIEIIMERTDLLPQQRRNLMTANALYPSLSMLLFEAGRYEEALSIFEDAREYGEPPVNLSFNGSRMLLQMGRAEDVLRGARSGSAYSGGRARFYKLRYEALGLAALDSLDAARQVVRLIYDSENEWGGQAEFIARKVSVEIALAEGNPERALEILSEIKRNGVPVGHTGGLFVIEYQEALARAYWMAGRLDDAAKEFGNLLRIYGFHATAHYELGQVYEEMNRPEDAKRHYERFLEMWKNADEGLPQLEDARARLAKLKGV
jgi:serine/threonine protein kinase/tetratricopeptide (TPR) repeat protein